MPSLDKLETKWQALASEIASSVRKNLRGNMYHAAIETVRESLDRLQVGVQELRRSSHILSLYAYSIEEGCETDLAGWLCFGSCLEMLLYLKHVWLALIRRELIRPGDPNQETFALLEQAVEISIRARRIPNSALKEMIWVGLAAMLDGTWLGPHFDIDDRFSVSEELMGDYKWISENEPRLLKLIHTVDVNNPLHLELLETWLAGCGER